MKKLRCKIKDCSSSELIRLAKKSVFAVVEGGRHSKIKTIQGKLVTTIPRHNRVDRFTAKEVVASLNRFGANIEIC